MPTVEERISSLESKIDAIADLRTAVGELGTVLLGAVAELRTDMNRRFGEVDRRFGEVDRRFDEFRADMSQRFEELRTDTNRQFGELRADMDRRFDEVDRRFGQVDQRFEKMDRRTEILDQRMDRHFMWMVGIQFTVLIAVIVALIQMAPR